MKRVYVVIELADDSEFDPASDDDQDALAEDLLQLLPGVVSATVYISVEDMSADEETV